MTTATLFPPAAARIVDGPRLEFVAPATWIFRLPRQLRSLNATMWGHWRNQARERDTWRFELQLAIDLFEQLQAFDGWTNSTAAAWLQLRHQRERRRVFVTRYVPSPRNFLRDDGNVRACDKHLVDALKHLGLIHDDTRTWIEHVAPTQELHPGGLWMTRVQLDRPDVRSAWRA